MKDIKIVETTTESGFKKNSFIYELYLFGRDDENGQLKSLPDFYKEL